MLNRRELIDMLECPHNGRWFEPPIPVDGLARAFRVSPHHSSAIYLKRNLLAASFVPSPQLSRAAFEAFAQDYLVFGYGYLEERLNVLGGVLRYEHALAKFTRRGVEPGRFFFVPGHQQETEFRPGSVVMLRQPDVNQEIYGVPEYLSALQSALLNEAATLFRRRYYLNGSHAGYILYATGDIDADDTDKLRDALRKSKGPGNFKNLFVHAPNGKEGSLKILPIAEVAAKDEFLGIKTATRDDVLAAHRTPPALLGIVPAQGTTPGNPLQSMMMFVVLEIQALQARFLQVNEDLGRELIAFDNTKITVADAA
ncbi:MAG TPA: phage portal protein [Sphingomonas sp.]|nr:phage portal protein [Sphingomonas sp.]